MMSTLSNEISEDTGPFKPKFHLWHPNGLGDWKFLFLMKIVFLVWLLWQRRVSILIMGKIEKWHLLPSYCRYLDESFIEMFLK